MAGMSSYWNRRLEAGQRILAEYHAPQPLPPQRRDWRIPVFCAVILAGIVALAIAVTYPRYGITGTLAMLGGFAVGVAVSVPVALAIARASRRTRVTDVTGREVE